MWDLSTRVKVFQWKIYRLYQFICIRNFSRSRFEYRDRLHVTKKKFIDRNCCSVQPVHVRPWQDVSGWTSILISYANYSIQSWDWTFYLLFCLAFQPSCCLKAALALICLSNASNFPQCFCPRGKFQKRLSQII